MEGEKTVKNEGDVVDGSQQGTNNEGASGSKKPDEVAKTAGKLKLMQLIDTQSDKVKTEEDAKKKNFAFWNTQPVPKIGNRITDASEVGPIEEDKSVDEIRAEPYSLPSGFSWDTLDLNDPDILTEVYTLLTENYVEDDDNMFRFNYAPEFIAWALQPPDYEKDWHVGVRSGANRKLVGFISGVPAHIQVHGVKQKMAEINFLCVHKKLRSKRVTPVLVREITRRVNRKGMFQAIYTAGVYLPTPFSTARYYHRTLNAKKLVETGFSGLRKNQTLQRMQKLYKLPTEVKTKNLRQFEKSDVPELTKLLNSYLQQFSVSPIFTEAEVAHWFTPLKDVVYCYVVTDGKGALTDMISFYNLPSQVMNNPKHDTIKAAYSFYNVHTETPLIQLMSDALTLAKNDSFDVFNCLNVMTNSTFVDELKFGIGDGSLHYYLYNFKCPQVDFSQIGLVLQ